MMKRVLRFAGLVLLCLVLISGTWLASGELDRLRLSQFAENSHGTSARAILGESFLAVSVIHQDHAPNSHKLEGSDSEQAEIADLTKSASRLPDSLVKLKLLDGLNTLMSALDAYQTKPDNQLFLLQMSIAEDKLSEAVRLIEQEEESPDSTPSIVSPLGSIPLHYISAI